MEKFLLINKQREATGNEEDEGSQSLKPHTPITPTPKTTSVTPEDVAPSTSVVGGKQNQDETAFEREELVIYGPHLPEKKCGAYRKKLAKPRWRKAEGNLRPRNCKVRKKRIAPGGLRRERRGIRVPRPRATETTNDYGGWAMCPLRAGAQ